MASVAMVAAIILLILILPQRPGTHPGAAAAAE
jgi:hypothetical protein